MNKVLTRAELVERFSSIESGLLVGYKLLVASPPPRVQAFWTSVAPVLAAGTNRSAARAILDVFEPALGRPDLLLGGAEGVIVWPNVKAAASAVYNAYWIINVLIQLVEGQTEAAVVSVVPYGVLAGAVELMRSAWASASKTVPNARRDDRSTWYPAITDVATLAFCIIFLVMALGLASVVYLESEQLVLLARQTRAALAERASKALLKAGKHRRKACNM